MYLSRFLSGDVSHNGSAAFDCANGVQVNANDQAAHWHVLHSHLKPSSCASQQQFELKSSVPKVWQSWET